VSDFIFRTTGDDKICPVGGNYEVFANAGNDTPKGGAGRDAPVGYLDRDMLDGGDTLDPRDGVSGTTPLAAAWQGPLPQRPLRSIRNRLPVKGSPTVQDLLAVADLGYGGGEEEVEEPVGGDPGPALRALQLVQVGRPPE
jgi:hypothetical protein